MKYRKLKFIKIQFWIRPLNYNSPAICNFSRCYPDPLARHKFWDAFGNSGMRYMEESDCVGGKTDC